MVKSQKSVSEKIMELKSVFSVIRIHKDSHGLGLEITHFKWGNFIDYQMLIIKY